MHLAIFLPGGSATGQDPFDNWLALVTRRVLEQAGALVVPVHYDDSTTSRDDDRFYSGIRREVRGALSYYQPDRPTVVARSRGTHALALLCVEDFGLPDDTRFIWLAPVWVRDRTWKAACASPVLALHIVGLADAEYHDPERHRAVPGNTIEIPGGDHGFEIAGDIVSTLDAWRTIASECYRFAARM